MHRWYTSLHRLRVYVSIYTQETWTIHERVLFECVFDCNIFLYPIFHCFKFLKTYSLWTSLHFCSLPPATFHLGFIRLLHQFSSSFRRMQNMRAICKDCEVEGMLQLTKKCLEQNEKEMLWRRRRRRMMGEKRGERCVGEERRRRRGEERRDRNEGGGRGRSTEGEADARASDACVRIIILMRFTRSGTKSLCRELFLTSQKIKPDKGWLRFI